MSKKAMTALRFRECIDALGFTYNGFARFVSYDERTVRRWAHSEKPVPRVVALLLEMMMNRPISIRTALGYIGDESDPSVFGDTRINS